MTHRAWLQNLLDAYAPRLAECRTRVMQSFDADALVPPLIAELEGGKMLRALLVHLAGAAVDGSPDALDAGAASVELLHAASLVHDDIIDAADRRRGHPALHIAVGTDAALVLGDYMIVRAFGVLAAAAPLAGAERTLRATVTLGQYAEQCCIGQFMELNAPRVLSEDQYLGIVRRKTASQFAAAAAIGVTLGGGTGTEIEAARNYGIAIGVAYQIRDDVLDIIGNADILGKPVGNSVRHGRPMLPIIYLAQTRSGRILAATDHVFSDRRQLAAVLERDGNLDRVTALQNAYIKSAVAELEPFAPSPHIQTLIRLAECIGTRTN